MSNVLEFNHEPPLHLDEWVPENGGHGFLSPTRVFNGIRSSPGRLEADDRLIFLHFVKTAGSTVRNCLATLFDPAEICPERNSGFAIWPAETIKSYRFFSSHSKLKDFRNVSGPLKLITFLRNPIERSLSLFQYWASYNSALVEQDNLHRPRFAKALGVKALFAEEHADQFGEVWNMYAAGLVGNRFTSPTGQLWRSSEEIVECAIKNLDAMAFVGISEDLDASFARMSKQFDIPNPYCGQAENVTKTNHLVDSHHFEPIPDLEVTQDLLDVVANANRLDSIIYRHALKKFYGAPVLRRQFACVAGHAPDCRTRVGHHDTWVQAQGGGFLIYGPYIRLLPGRYCVEFQFRCAIKPNTSLLPAAVGYADVVAQDGVTILGRRDLGVDVLSTTIRSVTIEFNLQTSFNDVQFRVFAFHGFALETNKTVTLTTAFSRDD